MSSLREADTIVTPCRRRERGPWGTTYSEEKRFGYPPPRRDRVRELEDRLEQLERELHPDDYLDYLIP